MASQQDEAQLAERRESMNSDQHSKAEITDCSEKDISDPEKETLDLDGDIEKQAHGQLPLQETVDLPETEALDPSIVEFDGPDDPDNPKNWTARRRAAITIAMGLMTFVVTFSSSIFAVAIQPVSEEFNVGTPVATLGVSFFLLVSASGALTMHPVLNTTGFRSRSSSFRPCK